MAEFSYETDIAPLASRYFPVTNVRASDVRALDRNYAQNIQPLLDQSLKIQGMALDDLRQASMMQSYETRREIQQQQLEQMRLSFQLDKEKAANEAEAADLINSIEDRLKDLSPEEQQETILGVLGENPTLGTTKLGSTWFNIRGRKVEQDLSNQQRIESQDEAEFVRSIRGLGQFSVAEQFLNGEISKEDAAKIADEQIRKDKQIKLSKEQLEQQLGRLDKDESEALKAHHWTSQSMANLETLEDGTIDQNQLAQLAAGSESKELKLKPASAAIFKRLLSEKTGQPLAEIEDEYKGKDIKLYTDYLDALRKVRNYLQPANRAPTTQDIDLKETDDDIGRLFEIKKT